MFRRLAAPSGERPGGRIQAIPCPRGARCVPSPLRLATARRFAGVAVLSLVGAAPAYADEPPTLRQGLWQFERTVGGQKLPTQECVNPTEDMQRQNALLEKSGCKFSPGQRTGKTYTFTADCSIKPPGGGAAVTVHSTSVMTVENDSDYKVEITTTAAGTTTPELLLARRIGDCTK
jgi:hypothetical protein